MSTKISVFFVLALLVFASCEKKNSVPAVSERIKQSYKAQKVTHDGIEVYTLGGSLNLVPEYSTFLLDLRTASTVSYKDITPETFSGSYSVTDNSLTLSGLTPVPTGANGQIEFDITSLSDDGKDLVLTRRSQNPKTGSTINVYTLKAN